MRASLVRFCASVHIPAAVANNLDRRLANPVHPAWMITDALSRFVQDSPVSRLCDIEHDPNSASFLLLSIWTPVIELLCNRVLTLNLAPCALQSQKFYEDSPFLYAYPGTLR
jgi:hypothetical protein